MIIMSKPIQKATKMKQKNKLDTIGRKDAKRLHCMVHLSTAAKGGGGSKVFYGSCILIFLYFC
jgi:hypothetical protein